MFGCYGLLRESAFDLAAIRLKHHFSSGVKSSSADFAPQTPQTAATSFDIPSASLRSKQACSDSNCLQHSSIRQNSKLVPDPSTNTKNQIALLETCGASTSDDAACTLLY
jgi:hypothetical protein